MFSGNEIVVGFAVGIELITSVTPFDLATSKE